MTTEIATHKVLVSDILMEQWATRDTRGNLITYDWGEPDADGFHTPTFTVHYDDNIVAAARDVIEAARAYAKFSHGNTSGEKYHQRKKALDRLWDEIVKFDMSENPL